MQTAVLEPVVDSPFQQWLRRVINDPIRPGVVDLSEFPALKCYGVGRPEPARHGRPARNGRSPGLSLEELMQLRLALQSNRGVKMLKIPFDASSMSTLLDGLRQLAGTLGELTVLEHLTIFTQFNDTMGMVIIAF
jgi:hypothetical protein